MNRKTLCTRIVGNVTDIHQELKQLRKQLRRSQSKIYSLQQEIGTIIRGANGQATSIARLPKRLGSYGVALDVLGAIAQVATDDSAQRIQALQSEISALQREGKSIEDAIRLKERLLQDQQGEFNSFQCYDMGFSHEVLNLH